MRYIKLYGDFFKNNMIRNLQFKESFFLTLGEGLLLFAINLTFYNALFLNIGTIGIWSQNEVMVLIATYQIYIGLFYGLFSNNLPGFAYYINKGDLDYMLVKPISTQFYISTRYISIGHMVSSLAALPLLSHSLKLLNISPNIGQYFLYILLLINGLVIGYSLLLSLMSIAIWLIKVNGIYIIMMQILSFGCYPSSIFKGVFKFIFSFIVPIIIISNYPAEIFLRTNNAISIITSFLITIILFIISNLIFRKALDNYSSASS